MSPTCNPQVSPTREDRPLAASQPVAAQGRAARQLIDRVSLIGLAVFIGFSATAIGQAAFAVTLPGA